MRKIIFGAIALAFISFASCSDDEGSSINSNLSLVISGLEDLGADFVYEGWIIVNGVPQTTGKDLVL